MRASAHHSIRKLFAVGITIVLLASSPRWPPDTKPFHLEKVCDTGTHCVVTASNFAAIPAGSEIDYTGRTRPPRSGADDQEREHHRALRDREHLRRAHRLPEPACSKAGTGRLTQFHLDAAVTFDGTRWYWDGWYWFGN